MREPTHNLFHLSALREYELAPPTEPQARPWAAGIFRGDELTGVVMALRGTGGVYFDTGDEETLSALAELVVSTVKAGTLSLISAHISHVKPLLPLIQPAGPGLLMSAISALSTLRTLLCRPRQAASACLGLRSTRTWSD